MLSEREWHQIRAALIFWRATMHSSRVHPMAHRAVRHLFQGDHHTPLTEDELEKLIYLDLVIPTCTIRDAIVGRNLKASQVRDWCGKHGIKPVNRVGRYNRYKVSDLRTVLRALTR